MFGKKQNVVKKHEAISDDAFSLFTDTVNMLESADTQISEDINLAEVKVNEAQSELDSLNAIQNKNANFKNKISKFLNQL